MLSEEEKRELKAQARSARLREEFELLRKASRRNPDEQTIDAYLSFVTCLQRLSAMPPPPRPFHPIHGVP